MNAPGTAVTGYLGEETFQLAAELARLDEKSVSRFVREAVERYVDAHQGREWAVRRIETQRAAGGISGRTKAQGLSTA